MSRKKFVSIPAVAIRSIFLTLLVRDGPFRGRPGLFTRTPDLNIQV